MSIVRSLLNTQRWMDPRLIPMRPDVKFRARLHSGHQVECETYRKEFAVGISVRSDEVSGLKFNDIESWLGF